MLLLFAGHPCTSFRCHHVPGTRIPVSLFGAFMIFFCSRSLLVNWARRFPCKDWPLPTGSRSRCLARSRGHRRDQEEGRDLPDGASMWPGCCRRVRGDVLAAGKDLLNRSLHLLAGAQHIGDGSHGHVRVPLRRTIYCLGRMRSALRRSYRIERDCAISRRKTRPGLALHFYLSTRGIRGMLKFIIDPKESLHASGSMKTSQNARSRGGAMPRGRSTCTRKYTRASIANIGSKSAITMGKVDGLTCSRSTSQWHATRRSSRASRRSSASR